MKNIFIPTTTFAQFSTTPLQLFEENGYNVVLNDKGRKLNEDELVEKIPDFDGILAGTEVYSKRVLNKAVKLRAISRLGVGIDNIDLEFAKKKGIRVYKTWTTPAPAVAELTLGLMLDVVRKITVHHQNLISGRWQKQMGNLLKGKTLGIVGLGTIGKTLVRLVKGFNFNILAFDLFYDNKYAEEHKINYCDIDTLLSQSDIVSIHLNLTADTKGIMSKERLNKMKPESILINTSRGEIIDEEILYKALKEKNILGAGLDVFNEEPYSGLLTELDNVVLTPHIGAYAKELRIKMEIEAAENIIKGLEHE